MLAERGKSLAVRETVPATGRALHPLRVLLKIWMNGPGGLVARASRDEIFAGVAATDGSRSVRLLGARRSRSRPGFYGCDDHFSGERTPGA